jgi:hypothetical protein
MSGSKIDASATGTKFVPVELTGVSKGTDIVGGVTVSDADVEEEDVEEYYDSKTGDT